MMISVTKQSDLDANLTTILLEVRPDLIMGEWAMLLKRPIWAVVATPQFGEMLRKFFSGVPGIENLHVLVHGREHKMRRRVHRSSHAKSSYPRRRRRGPRDALSTPLSGR